jgi:hypothetical protein
MAWHKAIAPSHCDQCGAFIAREAPVYVDLAKMKSYCPKCAEAAKDANSTGPERKSGEPSRGTNENADHIVTSKNPHPAKDNSAETEGLHLTKRQLGDLAYAVVLLLGCPADSAGRMLRPEGDTDEQLDHRLGELYDIVESAYLYFDIEREFERRKRQLGALDKGT